MANDRQRTRQAVERAIALCGSQAELARRLGVKRQAVTYYLRNGVPLRRLDDVVRACKGGITRRQLRPDLVRQFGGDKP